MVPEKKKNYGFSVYFHKLVPAIVYSEAANKVESDTQLCIQT
jgi:hypothetical protein